MSIGTANISLVKFDRPSSSSTNSSPSRTKCDTGKRVKPSGYVTISLTEVVTIPGEKLRGRAIAYGQHAEPTCLISKSQSSLSDGQIGEINDWSGNVLTSCASL